MEFTYHLPVNILFGQGNVKLVGEKAQEIGTCALIVTGGKSTKRSGLLATIEKLLDEKKVNHVLFDKVTPNPFISTVYEGATLAQEKNCDLVIAVGGGSSIDAAKAIAFQIINGGDISDYLYGRKASDKALPLIAIPTTCGTGSEGNSFAVLTNAENGDKKALKSRGIIPRYSIIDPLVMMTMPGSVLVSVGFDALCHNMESYLAQGAQPFTDILSLEGVKRALEGLSLIQEDDTNTAGWDSLCLASTIGGMVIHTAGVIAVHGMEHPVSGLKNVIHGRGLAALAPEIYKRSIDASPLKFAQLSLLFGGKDQHDFLSKLNELREKLNLTQTLSDFGVQVADLDWLTENCLKVSAHSITNHPLVFSKEEIKDIYRCSL